MFEPTARTLVCVIGNLRGGPLAWTSLERRVLTPLQADLAVLASYSADVFSAFPRAKHVWRVAEPLDDWANLLNQTLPSNWRDGVLARGNVWGGIRWQKSRWRMKRLLSGSGAIVLVLRLVLLSFLDSLRGHAYRYVVMTRSDHYYACDHPPISLAAADVIVPSGEGWSGLRDEGVTDRHTIFSFESRRRVLSTLAWLVDGHDEARFENVEMVLRKYYATQHLRVQTFSRVMFGVWRPSSGDRGRWWFSSRNVDWPSVHGCTGHYLKYRSEYVVAASTCGLPINRTKPCQKWLTQQPPPPVLAPTLGQHSAPGGKRLRIFRDVCLHIDREPGVKHYFRTNVHGLAWPVPPQLIADRSRDPVAAAGSSSLSSKLRSGWSRWNRSGAVRFSRHVGFGESAEAVRAATKGRQPDAPTLRLPGLSWFVDFSHGGASNIWMHPAVVANTVYPFFEALLAGELDGLPAMRHLLLWQVPTNLFLRQHFARHHLGLAMSNALHRQAVGGGAPRAPGWMAPKGFYLMREDLPSGSVVCFEAVAIVRETTVGTDRLSASAASMSSQGAALGFSSRTARLQFRSAMLWHFELPPPDAKMWAVDASRLPVGKRALTYLERSASGKNGLSGMRRSHLLPTTTEALKAAASRHGYELRTYDFDSLKFRAQVEALSSTHVLIAPHGASLTMIPLLSEGAAVIELFSCGHFSQLYANLARSSQVWYRAVHPSTPAGCATPPSKMDDPTRDRMNGQHGFTVDEIEPLVLQAIRYQFWFDHPLHVAQREYIA